MKKGLIFLAVCCLLIWQNVAWADLLISPTRVAFLERDRTHQVTLINNGTERRTYRIEWVEQTLLPAGGYKQEVPEGFKSASPFLRYSPKQVSLGPGERQIIKLLLRKPQDFADGEYRSHLKFVALPPESEIEQVTAGIAMKLDAFLSYSIPIVIRQGSVDRLPNIEQVNFFRDSNNKAQIRVDMKKDVSVGFVGNVIASFKTSDGNETEIARLNSVNFFHEQNARQLQLVPVHAIPSTSGEIITRFSGIHEYAGSILAEHKTPVQ